MNEARVSIEGYDELASGTRRLAEKIDAAAPKRFEGIAQQVADQVRSEVPVVSGALAASVTAETQDGQAIVGLGEGVPYAGWIEFGGPREGGRNAIAEREYIAHGRYLYPAAFDVEAQLVAAGTRTAEDEIGGMRWETPSP